MRAYERGAAAALSILTDGPSFGGSLDDLREARAATDLPILRKDFTVDPYQLYEAVAAGADAVLLVVAMLDPEELQRLHAEASELDLDCLVEVHDGEELERALEIDADVIGINNRDLSDFSVDLSRTFDLLTDVPAGKTVVSESGIGSRDQVEELERVGRRRRAGRGAADALERPRAGLPRADARRGADAGLAGDAHGDRSVPCLGPAATYCSSYQALSYSLASFHKLADTN